MRSLTPTFHNNKRSNTCMKNGLTSPGHGIRLLDRICKKTGAITVQLVTTPSCSTLYKVTTVWTCLRASCCWGRYHGGRRPSSDDSFSQSNRHSTIGTRQTEYHEALPSSANDEVRCGCTFTDDVLSSADGGMTVGLLKLSSLDGRRPP